MTALRPGRGPAEMIWLWLIPGMVAGLAFSAFFSGCETGLYCLNTIRLELGRRMGRGPAQILSRMLHDREGSITTTLVGTNLSNYLATACAVAMLIEFGIPDGRAEVLTTVLLTPVIFVFAEVTPKNLFRREADLLMYRLAWPLRLSDLLFRWLGVIALLRGLARLAARWVGVTGSGRLASLGPRQRIAAMLRESVGEGVLSDEQSAIVDRVMRLSSVPVRMAMIDRRHARTVSVGASREAFIEQAKTHRFSRVPVIDRAGKVVGIVQVFDVLMDEQRRERPVPEFMFAHLRLSPEQSVTSALTAMQSRGVGMAIVTDSHDRFLGIVTLKDLIEEIVGELKAW